MVASEQAVQKAILKKPQVFPPAQILRWRLVRKSLSDGWEPCMTNQQPYDISKISLNLCIQQYNVNNVI